MRKIKKYLSPSGSLPKRRLKFTPEQIALFESSFLNKGMNNSEGLKLKEKSILALQHLELEKRKEEARIRSRSERPHAIKRKATPAERLRGGGDEYELTTQVIGMSGRDPLLGTIFDLYVGGKGAESLFKSGSWLYNNGKIILKSIPYNSENFYRAVGKDAIKDAQKSGIIRSSSKEYLHNPYFSHGRLFWTGERVIEGRQGPVLWVKAKGPNGEYNLDDIIKPGEKNLSSGYVPTEVFPYSNGSTQVLTEGFSYWKKHPIVGWREYKFKQGGKMNTLLFLKNGSGIHIKNKLDYEKIKKYLSPSGSLPKPNLFQRPDGSYFYSDDGKTEINLTPLNKLTDDPAEWTYTDETGRVYTPKKEYKNIYTLTESNPIADYHNYLNLKDKSSRDKTMAKAYLNNGNLYDAFMSYMGMRAPKNPFEITGEPTILPGRATPQLVLLSAKLMETINNYWKNLGKLKIRLSGGRATSGILTKPGTASTTFNGLNINYITSPKGGNVTHKFYTDLGSEYILTKDGFARRIKSPHNNTLGQNSGPTEWNAANSDAGLHNWNEGTTIFTEGEDGKLFNAAFYKLNDFGFKPGTYGLARKGEKARIMLIDPKTKLWRAAMLSDVYPTTVKWGLQADRVMETNYSDVPKLGWHILEKANGGWHPGSPVAFIEGLKQGGKMNTLLFLKNGSGIHIKKKNRGKFTDYCGGKVTDECIRRAKASGNPTLVKRATFADNARHWKHKNGGKAFVEGVNVLDSNPKAYKYVKKKYKMRMALDGIKFDWASTLGNVGSSILQGYFLNKKISREAEAAKAMNKLTSLDFFNIYNLKLQEAKLLEELLAKAIEAMTGTTINSSNIVAANNAWKNASGEYAALKNNVDLQNRAIDAQVQALKSNIWGNAISGVMLQGVGLLSNYLNNKKSSNITTGITTPSITAPSYNYFSAPKKFGTFNNDGSMNLGYNMTYSIDKGIQTKKWSDDIFNKSYADYLK